jgi:hypothetical protein
MGSGFPDLVSRLPDPRHRIAAETAFVQGLERSPGPFGRGTLLA